MAGNLVHYVIEYHLQLDKNSIKTMRDNSWHIKNFSNKNYDDLEIV